MLGRLLRAAAIASGVMACSSIPDVVFADLDAATPSGADAGPLVSDAGDAGDARDWSCPDRPPPEGRGVCCGPRLCLRCTDNHCDRCRSADCDRDEVCCGRGNGGVACRSRSSCE